MRTETEAALLRHYGTGQKHRPAEWRCPESYGRIPEDLAPRRHRDRSLSRRTVGAAQRKRIDPKRFLADRRMDAVCKRTSGSLRIFEKSREREQVWFQ